MILLFHNLLHFAKLLNKKYGTHTESRILHLHKIFYSAEIFHIPYIYTRVRDNSPYLVS